MPFCAGWSGGRDCARQRSESIWLPMIARLRRVEATASNAWAEVRLRELVHRGTHFRKQISVSVKGIPKSGLSKLLFAI